MTIPSGGRGLTGASSRGLSSTVNRVADSVHSSVNACHSVMLAVTAATSSLMMRLSNRRVALREKGKVRIARINRGWKPGDEKSWARKPLPGLSSRNDKKQIGEL